MMTLIYSKLAGKLDEDGNPSPQNLRGVSCALGQLARMGVVFDMRSNDWSVQNPCGTPCCHAGAFAVAAGLHKRGMHLAGTPEGDILGNYQDAAAMLAVYLGFTGDEQDSNPMNAYCRWARDNHNIWGNLNGERMFTHAAAFCAFGDPRSVTLMNIADHYRCMAAVIDAQAEAKARQSRGRLAGARRRRCTDGQSQHIQHQ